MMILLVLLAIGFLITGGALGANIIGAFSLVVYGWWVLAGIITVAALFIIFGMTAIGAEIARDNKFKMKGGAILGGSIGLLLASLLCLYTYFMLWLSYFIIEKTDATATTWDTIGADAQTGIIAYSLITLIFLFKNKFISQK